MLIPPITDSTGYPKCNIDTKDIDNKIESNVIFGSYGICSNNKDPSKSSVKKETFSINSESDTDKSNKNSNNSNPSVPWIPPIPSKNKTKCKTPIVAENISSKNATKNGFVSKIVAAIIPQFNVLLNAFKVDLKQWIDTVFTRITESLLAQFSKEVQGLRAELAEANERSRRLEKHVLNEKTRVSN